VTPSDRLLRFVWRDDGGDVNVLKTHISHVRQKLSAAGVQIQINAIPGIGYMLKTEDGDTSAA
jgi:DNA-binding winged helix-turn-helix (wHTH) protein